jgi:4'-phosphopantetheinyl transferase
MELEEQEDPKIMLRFFSMLSADKQQQISGMRFEMDRKLRICADVLVRYKACEMLKVDNRDLMFAKNKHGKPFLPGQSTFHFNISHTRNALVVCISDIPVGIDIEKMNAADSAAARKVFTGHEIAYIFRDDKDDCLRFNEIWTKKESYLKWTGEGWSPELAGTDVLCEPLAALISTKRINQYTISQCCESQSKEFKIDNITLNELYQNLKYYF